MCFLLASTLLGKHEAVDFCFHFVVKSRESRQTTGPSLNAKMDSVISVVTGKREEREGWWEQEGRRLKLKPNLSIT